MCFQKNKKLILLLILVFVVIYLLTKYNEHFDKSVIQFNSQFVKEGNRISNNNLENNISNNSLFKNGSINNSIIMGSRIEDSEINNVDINQANINKLSTKGTVRFTGEVVDKNNTTSIREPFVLLVDPNGDQDQLLIDTVGRSRIIFRNNDSSIQIGDQLLTKDTIEYLNKLYFSQRSTTETSEDVLKPLIASPPPPLASPPPPLASPQPMVSPPWKCLYIPSYNNTMAVRLNPNGNPECYSKDGEFCYWGECPSDENATNLKDAKPVTCTETGNKESSYDSSLVKPNWCTYTKDQFSIKK